jgi:hypothetical protein
MFSGNILVQWGIHDAWRNSVETDALLCIFDRQIAADGV